jgi:hypothetical protein
MPLVGKTNSIYSSGSTKRSFDCHHSGGLHQPAAGKRPYTSKQMGDAYEMIVAGELTLAGVPAMKASDYWPGCDAVEQP